MVGYYFVYVLTVVGWHWYTTRRKRRLRREGEARSHFYGAPGQSGDELAGEPYRDDPDDIDRTVGQTPRGGSTREADAVSFERGPRIEIEGRAPAADDAGADDEDDDTDGDHERMVAAEVTRSMRVLRTGPKRHHNKNPIRPSLVGALEFRSALAQLQRESNLRLSPMSGRSYSENHVRGRGRRDTVAVFPDALHDEGGSEPTSRAASARRDRALSSGDIPVSSVTVPEFTDDEPSEADLESPAPQGSDSGQRTPTTAPLFKIGGSLAPPPTGVIGDGVADDVQGQGPSPTLRLQIPNRPRSHSVMSYPVPVPVSRHGVPSLHRLTDGYDAACARRASRLHATSLCLR